MVKFYLLQIKMGKIKLTNVPTKWRKLVKAELGKENG